MIEFDWQQVAALSLVALAGGYLARGAWRTVAGWRAEKAGCGAGCGSCTATKTVAGPLVTIENRLKPRGERGASAP